MPQETAPLIIEHLEAAGDGHAAYGWHIRAATWVTKHDIGAPRRRPERAAMRIAPRTMLCGIAFRVHLNVAGDRF
jgi:hypothetical protein